MMTDRADFLVRNQEVLAPEGDQGSEAVLEALRPPAVPAVFPASVRKFVTLRGNEAPVF